MKQWQDNIIKERWFNYRPICLVSVFLLLASVFSFYITKQVLYTSIITIFCLALLITIAIVKKKIKYFLVPLISFVVGIGMYYLAVASFNRTISFTPTTVQARINTVRKANDSYLMVQADSCVFDGKTNDDNIVIYIYDSTSLYENIEVGSVIKFKPYRFYHSDLFYHEIPNASMYSRDTKYTASVLMENVTYLKTDKTLAEKIKSTIKDNLNYGLTNENVEIAYSSLFGEKELLPEDQYEALRMSGVAHLLAVSGLHVGIITAVLYWILDRLKVRKWWRFGVICMFLLPYMYICGFSVSVVRASIMAILLLLAHLIHEQYDSFTALSIAAILIYIFNPLCIFDVAFLMSFGCGFGIAVLYKPIRSVLNKLHFNKAVVDTIALSLSTMITLLFIMAYFFRTLNVIALLTNVILIPIFTLAYIPIFILSVLSLIIPHITYLLYPINFVINFINLVALVFGNLKISNFSTIRFDYITLILYFVLVLILGRLCSAKYQYKVVATIPIVAMLFACLI